MRIIIAVLWKKIAIMMLKNANHIAVSHPFVWWEDSQLLKRSPPSLLAKVCAPTIIEGWVEKNALITCSLLPLHFHFRYKPLWPTWAWNIWHPLLWPQKPHIMFSLLMFLHTNADFHWLCTPVSRHANPVQPLSNEGTAHVGFSINWNW